MFLILFGTTALKAQSALEEDTIAFYSLYSSEYKNNTINNLLAFRKEYNPYLLTDINKKHFSHFLLDKIKRIKNDGSIKYAELSYLIAKELFISNYYYKSYKFINRTNAILEANNSKDIPFAGSFYKLKGALFYFFRRFGQARIAFKKALIDSSLTTRERIDVINSLGLTFREQNKIDSTILYFKKGIEIATATKNNDWKGIITGNLGFSYYLMREYKKAYNFISIDKNLSLKNHENGSALNAIVLLIKIDIKRNNIASINNNIKIIDSLAKIVYDYNTLKGYYQTKQLYWSYYGKYKKALQANNLAEKYEDSANTTHNETQFQKIEFQIAYAKQEAKNELLIEKEKRSRQFYYSIIIILFIIIVACVIIIYQVRKRKKKDELLLKLKNEKIEIDLRNNKEQLNQLFQSIKQKNEIIDAFKKEIKKNKALRNKYTSEKEKQDLYEKMQSLTLLTEGDLVKFRNVFNKIYPGFCDYLLSNYPELSNADMRLAMLIRLGFTRYEKSQVLGISKESVRKSIFRLRKKLDLNSIEDLNKFIMEINN